MTVDVLQQSVTIWLPLMTGIVTFLLTLYGVYKSRQERHRQRQALLAQLAAVAVRLTGATYVRPKFKDRIEAIIADDEYHRRRKVAVAGIGEDNTLWRMRLFCRLQREVGLQPEEKTEARTVSFNNLVDAIRGHATPPIDIRDEKKLNKNRGLLYHEIETAYNLNAQQSNAMIMDLATFAGPH